MKSHEPAESQDLGPFGVRVVPAGENRWTWHYVDPDAGLELHSNSTFATREEATDSAGRAYPGVPFVDDS